MLYKDFVREKSHHLTRIKSAEGYPCVFDKSKGKALKDYKVYGNSVQDGTPTPESPIEIESVGDLTTKNLLDVKAYFSDFLDDDGNMVYNQSNFAPIYNKFLLTNKFKENTQYTLSCTAEISNADNNGIMFVFYDSNNTILNKSNGYATGSKTFKVKLTNDANTTIKYVRIGYGTSTRRCDVKISNLQIEEGAMATEYEPYRKYKIPVAIVGKNVLNISEERIVLTGKLPTDNYSVEDGIMSFQTQFYAIANNKFGIKFNVKPNTSYSVSYTLITGRAHIAIYNMDGKAMTESNSVSGFKFTSGNNAELVFQMRSNSWNELVQLSDIMIRETNTTTSDYVSYYDGLTITNIFLDAPLRKLGNYVDYIDFKRQKVIRNISEVLLNGSEDWHASGYNSQITTNYMQFWSSYYREIISNNILSNKFKCVRQKEWENIKLTQEFLAVTANKDLGIRLSKSKVTSLDEFTQWLSENNVVVIFSLPTPREETIELPPILTQKGSNIITTDTIVIPSNIEVKYIAK